MLDSYMPIRMEFVLVIPAESEFHGREWIALTLFQGVLMGQDSI